MNCPGCNEEMAEQVFEGVNGKRLPLDLCHACHGLWFDTHESRQLTSGGTLRLFRELHGRRDERRTRATRSLACPRCRSPLARTHDQVRNHRFQYSRCPEGHGHFITFFQFLREKGIARGVDLKELVELRKHVDTLQCSDCGAPIELAKHAACTRCQAPVSLLDPSCVEATLLEAQRAAGTRHNVAPEVAARLLMNNLRMEGFHRKPAVQAAALASVMIPAAASQTEGSRLGDKAEHAVDALDALDLIGDGIDIVASGLEALGDLF